MEASKNFIDPTHDITIEKINGTTDPEALRELAHRVTEFNGSVDTGPGPRVTMWHRCICTERGRTEEGTPVGPQGRPGIHHTANAGPSSSIEVKLFAFLCCKEPSHTQQPYDKRLKRRGQHELLLCSSVTRASNLVVEIMKIHRGAGKWSHLIFNMRPGDSLEPYLDKHQTAKQKRRQMESVCLKQLKVFSPM